MQPPLFNISIPSNVQPLDVGNRKNPDLFADKPGFMDTRAWKKDVEMLSKALLDRNPYNSKGCLETTIIDQLCKRIAEEKDHKPSPTEYALVYAIFEGLKSPDQKRQKNAELLAGFFYRIMKSKDMNYPLKPYIEYYVGSRILHRINELMMKFYQCSQEKLIESLKEEHELVLQIARDASLAEVVGRLSRNREGFDRWHALMEGSLSLALKEKEDEQRREFITSLQINNILSNITANNNPPVDNKNNTNDKTGNVNIPFVVDNSNSSKFAKLLPPQDKNRNDDTPDKNKKTTTVTAPCVELLQLSNMKQDFFVHVLDYRSLRANLDEQVIHERKKEVQIRLNQDGAFKRILDIGSDPNKALEDYLWLEVLFESYSSDRPYTAKKACEGIEMLFKAMDDPHLNIKTNLSSLITAYYVHVVDETLQKNTDIPLSKRLEKLTNIDLWCIQFFTYNKIHEEWSEDQITSLQNTGIEKFVQPRLLPPKSFDCHEINFFLQWRLDAIAKQMPSTRSIPTKYSMQPTRQEPDNNNPLNVLSGGPTRNSRKRGLNSLQEDMTQQVKSGNQTVQPKESGRERDKNRIDPSEKSRDPQLQKEKE